MKLKKKTAFVKSMFNSRLEVTKFLGASIRTVSGIRGQIKKAQRENEGSFRATFEDKILMSDIVFLRAWMPVEVKKYYNPVTDLLLPEKGKWQGMKTVYQLRKEKNIPIPTREDSSYKPIERIPRQFNPLQLPKTVERELPFHLTKTLPNDTSTSLLSSSAVVLEPQEKKRLQLLQQVSEIKQFKQNQQKEKKKEQMEIYRKKKKKEELEKSKRIRLSNKKFYQLANQLTKDLDRPTKRRKISRKNSRKDSQE